MQELELYLKIKLYWGKLIYYINIQISMELLIFQVLILKIGKILIHSEKTELLCKIEDSTISVSIMNVETYDSNYGTNLVKINDNQLLATYVDEYLYHKLYTIKNNTIISEKSFLLSAEKPVQYKYALSNIFDKNNFITTYSIYGFYMLAGIVCNNDIILLHEEKLNEGSTYYNMVTPLILNNENTLSIIGFPSSKGNCESLIGLYDDYKCKKSKSFRNTLGVVKTYNKIANTAQVYLPAIESEEEN